MQKIRLWTLLLVIALLVPTQVPASSDSRSEIKWSTYSDARHAGNDSRKFFIYFYSDQCGYCKMMEQKTFKDKAVVAYLNNNYLPVRVNAGQEPRLASQFDIQGVPDLRFLTSEGEGIARWPGFIESGPLLTLLQYISTDSYKKMNFNDFVKENKQKQ
jgi:thioredoxin-related protein